MEDEACHVTRHCSEPVALLFNYPFVSHREDIILRLLLGIDTLGLSHLVLLIFFLWSEVTQLSKYVNKVCLLYFRVPLNHKLINAFKASIIEIIALSWETLVHSDSIHCSNHFFQFKRVDHVSPHDIRDSLLSLRFLISAVSLILIELIVVVLRH